MAQRDRHINLIAYIQYARFIRDLRMAMAVMRANPSIGDLAVVTPLGEPRRITKTTPVGQVLASAMIELEDLRAELGAKPLTAVQMRTPDSFDSAVWDGLEHLYQGEDHDRRVTH
tara:strand:+ start:193 stop:537 length:345 start_codon:yes stop_codon:yes gene_type:complete